MTWHYELWFLSGGLNVAGNGLKTDKLKKNGVNGPILIRPRRCGIPVLLLPMPRTSHKALFHSVLSRTTPMPRIRGQQQHHPSEPVHREMTFLATRTFVGLEITLPAILDPR